MENEIITIDWCKKHGFKQQTINVATDLTYYYEEDTCIICFTKRTCEAEKKLIVSDRLHKKTVEFSSAIITEEDLYYLCNLINIKPLIIMEEVWSGNKSVVNKKQPKYPTTYEECRELTAQWKEYDCNPNSELILSEIPVHDFCKLIVARNIYWKIAGEEMGLNKPWKPDWSTWYETKYVIEVYCNNIRKDSQGCSDTILAFPTEEMRDAFYENFKELIKKCKDLL